jgi:hypothetical protein
MIRPSPQTDELDRGYWGRVIRWNGWDNERNALGILRRQKANAELGSRQEPLIKLIAEIAGLSTEVFAQQHTILPLRRGITSYQTDLQHDAAENTDMLWTTSMRVSRPGAYFCPDCVITDIERQGYSYWRRTLQIPGLYQCSHHRSGLHYVDTSAAFDQDSEFYLKSGIQIPSHLCTAAQVNPAIQRYLTLAQAFLLRSEPLAVRPIALQLKNCAKEFGLQCNPGKVKQALLSDLVIAKFGREWLHAVVPKLAVKPEGEWFNPIDGVLYCQTNSSNTVAYLIAASALFETFDQAMFALENNSEAELMVSHRKSVNISKNELIKRYAATGGDYRATAEHFPQINDFVVRQRLQTLGLPNFSGRSHLNLQQAAIAFYLEEKSLIESAMVFGVPLQQLESLVRNAGCGFAKVLAIMAQDGERRYFNKTQQNLPTVCLG